MSWAEARRQRGQRAFRALWIGQSVSQLGSQISLVVLPLIAVVVLEASPFEVGLLAALETAPYLLGSLPAGILADHFQRRSLLILADVLRALVLTSVPIALVLGVLDLNLLMVVALLTGTLTMVFEIAFLSYVPELVPPEELVASNQRLEASYSVGQIGGPTLAGVLMATLGAGVAVIVDILTYLASALAIMRSPRMRRPQARPIEGGGLAAAMATGPRFLLSDRVLRDLAASTATFNLASSILFAVFILFATRDVGVRPEIFGLLYGLGNVGFLVGAGLVGHLGRRLGPGPSLFLAGILGGTATAIMPLAVGPAAALTLFVGRFVGAVSASIFNVNAYSIRQARVPDVVLGRVNASFKLLDWGTLPIGALLGGTVGSLFGVRHAIALAAILGVASVLWLVRSPVRELRSLRPLPQARPSPPVAASSATGAAAPTGADLPVSRA